MTGLLLAFAACRKKIVARVFAVVNSATKYVDTLKYAA
jgi:hypothetical protein